MSNVIQFDDSQTVIGGVNIAETVRSEQKLAFNESYTVVGDKLTAPALYACYDLTVIGDMEVTEIEVKGNLYVRGNIRAQKLSCHKSVICGGNINAEDITAEDVIANDITCGSIVCPGNIVARSAIDVRESLRTKKSAIAGEAILGSGQFSAKNAVAAEYVDFHGDVQGGILELETNAVFDGRPVAPPAEESFQTLSEKLREKIERELKKAGKINEDQLVEFVSQLSAIDEHMLSDWKMLTEKLVYELAYPERIANLRDYFILIMATKLLPEEIIGYETLEHIFENLLTDAEQSLDTLPFHAENVEELAYALKIAILCENELRIDKEEALDRIFQSIGIKYQTVKSFFGSH